VGLPNLFAGRHLIDRVVSIVHVLLLTLFLSIAWLTATRRLTALLALPLLAIVTALVVAVQQGLTAQETYEFVFLQVISEGSVQLSKTIIIAIFSGALSQVLLRQGIAQAIIARAAEYAGDRPLPLAMVSLMAVALNFCSLSGVGAILLLGSLVLPILVSSGIPPVVAGSLMLLGIALGALFNPLALQIYADVCRTDLALVRPWAGALAAAVALCALVYALRQVPQQRFCWAQSEPPLQKVNGLALLTPVLPLILMLKLPPLPALGIALIYGCLTTAPKRLNQELCAALVEGGKDVIGVVLLFVGLGMVLKVMNSEHTLANLKPLLIYLPRHPVSFALTFTLLAPLAAYRGPLTVYGVGGGLAGLLVTSGQLPPSAILVAFLILGQMQSLADPTCTHLVCVGQILGLPPEKLAWHLLPYAWTLVAVCFLLACGRLGL
jgi:DcuC family C4-dicarboxylate transporter